MAEILDRRRHAGPDRRLHRRPAHEGRDGRRADRAGATPCSTAAEPVALADPAPAWSTSCGTGGDRSHTHQRVDARRARRGRRRRPGVQARQPRPPRRRAAPPTCSRRSASPSTSGPTAWPAASTRPASGFCFAPRLPPGHAPRRPDPARARRADGLQLPRPAGQPGPGRAARSSASADPAHGRAHGRRARRPTGPSGRWSCTATTASTSSPPPPRRPCSSSATARCGRYDVDPAALGLARRRSSDLRGGDAATNAELARAVLAGDAGPAPRHRRAQRRRRPGGGRRRSTTCAERARAAPQRALADGAAAAAPCSNASSTMSTGAPGTAAERPSVGAEAEHRLDVVPAVGLEGDHGPRLDDARRPRRGAG